MVKLVDTKDLKLALLGVPVRPPRAPKIKMLKDSILLIFKDKKKVTKNQDFWIKKFSKGYNVYDFYIYEHLYLTNSKIVDLINKKIISENIKIVLIEGDHLAINDFIVISQINNKIKKGLFLGDDPEWHQVNLISAAACDFVLTDSLSSLKFKELGVNSIFCPVEANEEIFKDYKLNKDIDILFFGRKKPDTEKYFKLLDKDKIKYLSVDPYMEISNTTIKLAKLINRSKLVINFTKTLNGKKFFNPSIKYKYSYLAKGRTYMSGLCNTLCISEYAPTNDLLFPNGEIPTFNNQNQFLEIIKEYLRNEEKLINDTKIFKECCLKYSDKEYIKTLSNFIDNVPKSKSNINVKIPYWYYLITIKQYFRLRSKFNENKAYMMQFIDNFKLPKYLILINIFFFIRFLPNLILKIFQGKKNG